MLDSFHFLIFILVSLFAFVFILMFALRDKANSFSIFKISFISLIVVVGGMFFARYGANIGLPWWIYYCVPALDFVFAADSLCNEYKRTHELSDHGISGLTINPLFIFVFPGMEGIYAVYSSPLVMGSFKIKQRPAPSN